MLSCACPIGGKDERALIKEEYKRQETHFAVKKGDISSFVTFDIYKQMATKVEKEIVGKITIDGIMITGYKPHFVDRVIGQYESSNEPIKGMRKGVPVGDVLAALQNPDTITEKVSKKRKSRVLLIFAR